MITDITTANDLGQNKVFPEWKPFNMLYPADQKLTRLTVGKGGTAKQKQFFCPYCIQTSDEINMANSQPCTCCISLMDDEIKLPFDDVKWECLHHDIISKEIIAKMYEQLTSSISPKLQEQHENIAKNIKLKLCKEGDSPRNESADSVDFELQTLRSMEEFHALLMSEADLQSLKDWQAFHGLQQQL